MVTREKVLIVTTAQRYPLTKVFLPSLRSKGEYTGDVLIIDYGDCQGVNKLFTDILLVKSQPVYKILASDRHRAFYEALKDIYKNYDIIMVIDGSDIEFLKPIQPLLNMAKEEVCYVIENRANRTWVKYTGPPDSKEVWEYIKNRLIINCGMYVGPAELIFKIQKHIAENLIYNAEWGSDQLLFNALIYYYKIPSREVDKIWNYDMRGKTIIPFNTAILHRI